MESTFVPFRLTELSAQHFQPLVGQKLRFLRPSADLSRAPAMSLDGVAREAVELALHDVKVARFPSMRGKRQPFSLLFTLRDAAPLDDRHLHLLSHPEFEPCDLLLSRVTVPELDQHDGTMYYELIFG